MQVWTAIRASIAVEPSIATVEHGWMPEPADATIAIGDDLRFKDWQECRTTLQRLDQLLEDLRKFGFSLVTGLLTAGAFLGFVPTATSAIPPDVRAAIFIAIMVLVAALFSVDTYYQVLLSGAAERALDLEVMTDPPVRVTNYLSTNATDSKASYMILFLYLALLATAGGLGLLNTEGLNLGIVYTWGLNLSLWSTYALVWGGGLVAFLAASFLVYRFWPTRPDWLLLVIAGGLGLWFTVGLGRFLLEIAVRNPPAVLFWIVDVGVLLGVYIELYWIYVAWSSHLHREKPRTWPEGKGKVAAP